MQTAKSPSKGSDIPQVSWERYSGRDKIWMKLGWVHNADLLLGFSGVYPQQNMETWGQHGDRDPILTAFLLFFFF